MSIPDPPWKKRSESRALQRIHSFDLDTPVLRQLAHVRFIPKDVAFFPSPVVFYTMSKSKARSTKTWSPLAHSMLNPQGAPGPRRAQL
jgi:hypothetical protein